MGSFASWPSSTTSFAGREDSSSSRLWNTILQLGKKEKALHRYGRSYEVPKNSIYQLE
jgi:hypothetical protein